MFSKIKILFYKYKVFIKYVLSGMAGAFVNLGTLFILTECAHVYYLLSAIIAFFVSLAVGFNLQKKWTFRNNEKKAGQQALQYFSVTGLNLLVNTGLLYVLVEKFHIWYLLAQVLIYGGLAIFTFFIYRYIIFKTA